MKMVKSFQRDNLTNQIEYVMFEVTCKDVKEMDDIREIMEKELKEEFGKSKSFDSCYSGDEIANYDIVSFEYDRYTSLDLNKRLSKIWKKVKFLYKQKLELALYNGIYK